MADHVAVDAAVDPAGLLEGRVGRRGSRPASPAMALCISAQSTCICAEQRVRIREACSGTSTSVRVSTGRASRCGQEVRGRSRAAPQAGEVARRPRAAEREQMPAAPGLGAAPGSRRRRASARRRRSAPRSSRLPRRHASRGSGSRGRAPRTARGRSRRPGCPTWRRAAGCGRSSSAIFSSTARPAPVRVADRREELARRRARRRGSARGRERRVSAGILVCLVRCVRRRRTNASRRYTSVTRAAAAAAAT